MIILNLKMTKDAIHMYDLSRVNDKLKIVTTFMLLIIFSLSKDVSFFTQFS